MATIRSRSGKWQAIVKRKGHPPISKTFTLCKDAEKWARLQERLIDSGQWVDRTEVEQTTLIDLIERYAREISPTKNGLRAELYRLESFKRYPMARYSLAAITSQTIAQWRDDRLKEVSTGTALRELQLLSHLFAVAIKEWGYGLHSNPVANIRKPPQGQARDRVLNESERDALLAACASCRNKWVKPAVIFALETAARKGEILSLKWANVDLATATAKVDGKTGPRVLPLSPTCLAMLRILPRSLGGLVFPMTSIALRLAYEGAVARSGITDFTFHDLRHDALTRLAKRGFSVLELRAISGHTTANMLQRYVSIDAGDLARKLATS